MPAHPFKDRPEWKAFIEGQFVSGAGDSALTVRNPATSEVLGEVASASAQQVNDAVEAANKAWQSWRWTDPETRAGMLFEVAQRIRDHRDELVELETWENGKPLYQSLRDVTNAERTFRFYAGATDKFYGQAIFDSPETVRKLIYEPYGVVGVIIPWNWPPMHTADFASVALATGNTVVMKPAPETPLSSLRMAELVADVLPAGVFNVVPGGIEPGAQLVSHPKVDFIAFTGSDLTGEKILAAAAERIVPSMMELGGKNASLIFEDCNLERAIHGMVRSAYFNSGQACSGTERILVSATIYDEFLQRYCEATKKLKVGDGFVEGSEVGPMISRRQQEKILGAIEGAVQEGATIVAQAPVPTDGRLTEGFWVPPTVLTGSKSSSSVMRNEVFGPVPCVVPFDSEEDAVQLANSVDYGLTAGLWTRNLARGNRVAAKLQAGTVAVNCVNGGRLGLPFGGYKRSGVGRKKDFVEAMRTFSRAKAIQIDLAD